MSLQELYSKTENEGCKGCSILSSSKPFHCHKDYLDVGRADVLFLTDSYQYNGWEKEILNEGAQDLFNEHVLPLLQGVSYAISPAIKCPTVKDNQMDATNMAICRNWLDETVTAYSPKLIIPLGNLAFKMLTKKSGIAGKHGSEYRYNDIPVVPTFSISILFIEPKHKDKIQEDIRNGLNKFIHKNSKPLDLDWEIIESYDQFWKIYEENDLEVTEVPIAFDIETTGLNHLRDKILSIAFTWKKDGKSKSMCIPINHKDHVWDQNELGAILDLIKEICDNTNNIKIAHNAKFDMKFLKRIGIEVINVWDTKTMAHLIDEYQEKGLKSLVKKYFPATLEKL